MIIRRGNLSKKVEGCFARALGSNIIRVGPIRRSQTPSLHVRPHPTFSRAQTQPFSDGKFTRCAAAGAPLPRLLTITPDRFCAEGEAAEASESSRHTLEEARFRSTVVWSGAL